MHRSKLIIFSLLMMISIVLNAQKEVNVYYEESPQVEFALEEFEKVLHEYSIKKYNIKNTRPEFKGTEIIIATINCRSLKSIINDRNIIVSDKLEPEGFQLIVLDPELVIVIGYDYAGVMYGTFELAEQIYTNGLTNVESTFQNPYMKLRGTKFNIPLDVRTPSYSDVSDAAQKNIAEMWSFDFWKEYIDNLAMHRYNFISLWNLHPFPSMVKVPKYPDIALDDVQRSTIDWNEHYPLEGREFCAPEIINNVEVLKRMTIDDKIEFWRKVMSYGKKRNVDFFIVTWNIFVYGAESKYGITDDFRNEITKDYFRESVKHILLTYPDLKGIGLTTGENFEGANFIDKENWAFDTYGQGVLDVSEEQPERKITFVHRQHQTGALDIADKFKPLIENNNINFIFSFKYAKAHVYGSTKQTYHPEFVKEIQSRGNLETIWTLRNDDIYYFKWGAPDFVREFIKNIPYEVSQGYYYGSDQYIWGREFLSKFPEYPRQIEIDKHWYQWMLWGRLGYNPEIKNQLFVDLLGNKYLGIPKNELFEAIQNASMIYPITTGFHWGSLDFQWYIESGQSLPGPADTPTGFHDVNRFISLPPHPGSGNISIPDYIDAILNNKKMNGRTPVEVYTSLHNHIDKSLKTLDKYQNIYYRDTRLLLEDTRIICYLGKYYAHKIHAATELQFFRVTGDKKHQKKIHNELKEAAKYWRLYTSSALALHKNPLWTNRVGHVNWKENYPFALYDLTMTGSDKIFDVPYLTSGKILEAEHANIIGGKIKNDVNFYSDVGAIENSKEITWNYNAKEEMYYALDIRYGLKWGDNHPGFLKINDDENIEFKFWTTGNSTNLVWDRVIVKLKSGNNKIKLLPKHQVFIDNIKIQPFFK